MNNTKVPKLEEARQVDNSLLVDGETGKWEVIIGLEIHAQVVSKSKLFSSAQVCDNADENTNVSFVDAALPGTLPVLNRVCVEQAVLAGLALNSTINHHSVFSRKNYFYPDLPQGYQISQGDKPIVSGGYVKLDLYEDHDVNIRIERIHLEQDAGKSIHDVMPGKTFIDLNRAGVALLEIVTRPDIRSPAEAAACVRKIRTILKYIGVCDGDMEKGNLRADVNVSVRKPGDALGIRCELKNINSMRFITHASTYEARRHIKILEDGGLVQQETRLYDPDNDCTRPMRSKEEAHDYRYFPCPDLPSVKLDDAFINRVRERLPELPDDKKQRIIKEYGISTYDADVLTAEKENVEFFEEALSAAKSCSQNNKENSIDNKIGKMVANWLLNELFGYLNRDGHDISISPVSASQLGELVALVHGSTISGKSAKKVLEIMWDKGGKPSDIVKQENMIQMTDRKEMELICQEVIDNNPDKVKELELKHNLLGWFVGQAMKASNGTADPKVIQVIMNDKLKHQNK